MKAILNDLFEHKTLSRQESREALVNIAKGKYNNSQVAAFLAVYLMRSVSVQELSGFREAMLELCMPVDFDGVETIDIVGTGGDNKNTFNISTLSCFVVAGAGIKVAKHGNYGVSSVSGSSNVLERCGVKFTNDEDILKRQLEHAGICFLHAPLFHPAMKSVAPVRKELGVRTFFNLLGPIVNPSRPKYMFLGVYNLEIMRTYNYLLQQTTHDYMLIHGLDGYDEISLTSDSKMMCRSGEHIYHAEELPFEKVLLSEISGGDSPAEAAGIFMKILSGEGTTAQKNVVIANAGFAIHCSRPGTSLPDCFTLARESLDSGRALNTFNKLITHNS